MKKIIIPVIALFCFLTSVNCQYTTLNAHSHNDYSNDIPFWLAYYNHFGSIEADIWAIDGELFVSHDKAAIKPELTLDALYLQPIIKLVRHNKGKVWSNYPSAFQLLIDLKTPVEPTLSLLVEKLKKYPDVFDQGVNKNGIRIVITGNRPQPSDFVKYPDFIYFDGLIKQNYDRKQLERIALFSENFRLFTLWSGKTDLSSEDKKRVESVIDSAHALNKKIRFWNVPDDTNAWKIFMDLGVDFLNTDHINELSEFLNNRNKN